MKAWGDSVSRDFNARLDSAYQDGLNGNSQSDFKFSLGRLGSTGVDPLPGYSVADAGSGAYGDLPPIPDAVRLPNGGQPLPAPGQPLIDDSFEAVDGGGEKLRDRKVIPTGVRAGKDSTGNTQVELGVVDVPADYVSTSSKGNSSDGLDPRIDLYLKGQGYSPAIGPDYDGFKNNIRQLIAGGNFDPSTLPLAGSGNNGSDLLGTASETAYWGGHASSATGFAFGNSTFGNLVRTGETNFYFNPMSRGFWGSQYVTDIQSVSSWSKGVGAGFGVVAIGTDLVQLNQGDPKMDWWRFQRNTSVTTAGIAFSYTAAAGSIAAGPVGVLVGAYTFLDHQWDGDWGQFWQDAKSGLQQYGPFGGKALLDYAIDRESKTAPIVRTPVEQNHFETYGFNHGAGSGF
jgi:hypothetical protein